MRRPARLAPSVATRRAAACAALAWGLSLSACGSSAPTAPDAHVHSTADDAHDPAHDGGLHTDDANHTEPHDGGLHPGDADLHLDAHDHADATTSTTGDAGMYTGPTRLSETGLYRDPATHTLADGVLTYDVHYPLWSDGSEKLRYLYLPPGTTIDLTQPDRWQFPVGTRAWKEFRVAGRRLETRLLEKVETGWRMVSYVWDPAETDALATPRGAPDVLGTTHDVPDMEDCRKCHRGAADGLIGVSALQLGRDGVDRLVALGLIPRATAPTGDLLPPGTGVVRDALGYLHGNCGHCHNDLHPLSRLESLRLALHVSDRVPEDTPTYRTALRFVTRHEVDGTTITIVPGMPEQSQLWARMRTVVPEARMPSVGREVVDEEAVRVVGEWIGGL